MSLSPSQSNLIGSVSFLTEVQARYLSSTFIQTLVDEVAWPYGSLIVVSKM